MNWLHELYQTYESCSDLAGKDDGKGNILLPVGFMQVNIQIECVINPDATFNSAYVLEKDKAQTIIPSTTQSASRTSNYIAHPLFDKLKYIAKDLPIYSDSKSYYDLYKTQLYDWSRVESAPKCLQVLYEYLNKGTLIKDLVEHKILHINENKKLMNKWEGDIKEKPAIFKVLNGSQEDALVRFSVLNDQYVSCLLWKDKAVQTSFLDYYLPQLTQEDLSLISGEQVIITELHPSYLRYNGDSAKLISSEDKSMLRYYGRCRSPLDAVSIGYFESQKAHNALKWLIQRQGRVYDGLVTLTWGTSNPDVFAVEDEFAKLFDREEEVPYETGDEYAIALRRAIEGYKTKRFFHPEENIVVMSLDAATKGRLAILYYQSMKGSDYMNRICHWYETCSWGSMIYFKKVEGSDKKQRIIAAGTPTIKQILDAVYGKIDSDSIKKIKRNAKEKLLHCIVDKGKLPKVFVDRIFQQFCKITTIVDSYDREEFLAVGCAIMRKYYNDLENDNKEKWKMTLDLNKNNASYQWGRLLAYCVWFEKRAQKLGNIDSRDTNGERYMRQFQMNPTKTWVRLNELMRPYKNKFRKKNHEPELDKLEEEMNIIISIITDLDGNLKKLDDTFLMGYSSQLSTLQLADKNKNNKKEEGEQ